MGLNMLHSSPLGVQTAVAAFLFSRVSGLNCTFHHLHRRWATLYVNLWLVPIALAPHTIGPQTIGCKIIEAQTINLLYD
jgi:hypothetical protein